MTDNNKIIGLIAAWGSEGWIRPAVRQALEYCDEVLAVIAPINSDLDRFADLTYDICKEYHDIKLLDFKPTKQYSSLSRCEILNHMLKNSSLYAVGNWVWILDVDEFYKKSAYKEIKSAIVSGQYNSIGMGAKIFLINMQYYLKFTNYWRLIKIEDRGSRFKPTQNWSKKLERKYILSAENEMFHYSLLTNTDMRAAWWKANSPLTNHPRRRRWLKEIYLKYELENEDFWLNENLKLSGIKSPWYNPDFTPDENGRLFKYSGRHPKFIEKTDLTRIKDFRKYYNSKLDGE